jgi:hypothetical protein
MAELNTDDTNQIASRKKRFKLNQERELDELRELLKTSGGRWFLRRLLERCGLFKTTSGYDPYKMAIASGERDVGLWIIKEINEANPDAYLSLVREASTRTNDVRTS